MATVPLRFTRLLSLSRSSALPPLVLFTSFLPSRSDLLPSFLLTFLSPSGLKLLGFSPSTMVASTGGISGGSSACDWTQLEILSGAAGCPPDPFLVLWYSSITAVDLRLLLDRSFSL